MARWKSIGLLAGVLAALTGGAVAAEKVAARRLRAAEDPDAGDPFVPPYDELIELPSHDGGTIAVLSRGDGPPIVLSHGVTLSVRTWTKQMRELPERGFRTIAFDHRGHGKSVVGSDGHTIDTLAADVRTVVEGLDLRDAVLVGHSMGGVAVQAFVTRHPEVARERVAGIVLLSTLAKTHLGRSPRAVSIAEWLSDHTPDSTAVFELRDFGLMLSRVGFGRDPKPSHVELTRQMMLECHADTRRGAPRSLLGLDLTEHLGSVVVPTLVIGGTADVITPPAESRRIAAAIPGSRLELLEGGGHMLMLEQTERLDDLITEFARSVQGRAELWPEAGALPG